MNYFTPALIARGQSKDPRVVDEVELLWDEACDRYEASLHSIRADFPPGLLRMEESYYLHDADVREMGRGDRSFIIVLKLDTPPNSMLTFIYDLVAEAVIDRAALPDLHRESLTRVQWQYHEVGRVPGHPPTWFQSILFSNGWEVKLHFRDVMVAEGDALFPVPNQDHATVSPAGTSR